MPGGADKPKHPGGRPSKYDTAYAGQAEKLAKLGATSAEMADFFEVDTRTIERWASRHEEFCRALKSGKSEADARVERSLYHRAVGYTYDAVKIFNSSGQALLVPYQEHVPPDTTAAIFWLKNRKPGEWRDKREHELSGPDGGPIKSEVKIDPAKLSTEALREVLAAMEAADESGSDGG